MINHLNNRITNLITKARVTIPSKDKEDYAPSQISYLGGTLDSLEIYPYGMNAVAPTNTLALKVNVCGQAENLTHIPYTVGERFRNLKPGEVQFGSPATGSYIKFKEDGSIEIYAKKGITIRNDDENITIHAKKEIMIKNDDGDVNIDAKNAITIKNSSGDINITAKNNLKMSSLTNDISFNSAAGIGWTATSDSSMTSSGNFTITTTTYKVIGQVDLGNGGAKIARLGDQVTVGSNIGTITSAGNNTSI